MIRIAGDCSFQIAFPLDADLSPLVGIPARRFLRLCHLSPPVSRYLLRRLTSVLKHLASDEPGSRGRARLTLATRGGVLRMTLRVPASPGVRGLEALTRGTPPQVRAQYRRSRRGSVLSIRAPLSVSRP